MSIQLSPKKIQTVALDYEKSANLIELSYVTDQQPGITRIRKGKGFVYLLGEEVIKDKDELERIRKLVIPPAWENVWICKMPEGHLQATGYDARNRKQYRYHPLWTSFRNQTKFYRMYEFGNILGKIREQIKKDLDQPQLNERKVMALILRLMDDTGIRIGSEEYEKVNGSYGLTTLKDRHVNIQNGNTISFVFKGKKGVTHKISLKNKKLAHIVKQCRDLPGKELFQYYDENGEIKKVDSGMVNQYLKDLTGEFFTAKDFRTWIGSVHAIHQLGQFELPESKTEIKKQQVEALDYVASQLGNTRAVCKKYYVHPVLLELYEEGTLNEWCSTETPSLNHTLLSNEEKKLLTILEKAMHKKISLN